MDAPERQQSRAQAARDTWMGRRGFSITIAPRTIWYAAAAVVTLAVVWLLITQALAALLIIFIAVILGEAARPIVLELEHRRVPRALGVLLVLLVGAIILGLLMWLLIAPLVAEFGTLSSNAPTYTKRLQEWFASSSATLHTNPQIGAFIDNIAKQFFASLQGVAPTLIRVPFTLLTGVFGGLLSIVVVLTMTVFWLTSSEKLKAFALSLFPERVHPNLNSIFADMGRSLGGYVRGVLIAMLLIGIFTALGLGILGVPYALLLGVLAGLTECIPYLGPWLSGVVAVVVALVTVDPLKALEVVILFLVVQQVEGNLVQPIVMSRSVHLDPLLVLVAILVGSELMGLIGAVLAVPFVALLQSLVTLAIAPAIRAAWDRDDSPSPSSAPPDTVSDTPSVEAPSPA